MSENRKKLEEIAETSDFTKSYIENTIKAYINETCKTCRYHEERDNYCNKLYMYGMSYCSKYEKEM